jgi:hypothetical protein
MRQQNVNPAGFDVALEENDTQTTPHGSETIGWLAIEPGTGTWNGHKYEAAKTSDAVTHDWYAISFGQSFSQAPCFVASLGTYDGTDNAHLRYSRTSLTAGGVQVMVEEGTCPSQKLSSIRVLTSMHLQNRPADNLWAGL